MSHELLMAASAHDVVESMGTVVQHATQQTKTIALGAVGIVGAGAGVMVKRRLANAPSENPKNGRIRRVPAGHLGLRERNNRFYRSFPIQELDGRPVVGKDGRPTYTKEFFELVEPGFRISPLPLRKYELLDSRSISREITPVRVMGQNKRQYNVEARFEWGHIRGIDEHRERIDYRWANGESVSVEQLVFNGIMAGRGEHEVSEIVGGRVGRLLRGHLSGLEDAGTIDDDVIFGAVRDAGHDAWLGWGAELRSLEITQASPTDVDHLMNDFSADGFAQLGSVMSRLPGYGGLRAVGGDDVA